MEELVIGLTKIVFLLIFQIFLLYRKIPQNQCPQILQKVYKLRYWQKKACNKMLQALNMIEKMELFGYHFKFDLSTVTVSEINGCFIKAQFLHFVSDVNSSAVNFVTFLVADSTCDL